MFRKLTSLTLAIALVCLLGGTQAFGNTPPKPDGKLKSATAQPESSSIERKELQPNTSLRADVLKLVADAKAGKVMPTQPQMQPARSNGLSKGAKIGIGVGIGAAIVLVIALAVYRGQSRNPNVF
jgi:hypothetical protein